MSNDWTNDKKLNLRTKLALKILLLMVKVISPYQFEHQFKAELEKIDSLITEIEE